MKLGRASDGTPLELLAAHGRVLELIGTSLEHNVRDLKEKAPWSDTGLANAADIVRQNLSALISVAVSALEELDAAIVEVESEHLTREPADPQRRPATPDSNVRETADRLRGRLRAILREEPSLVADARQRVEDALRHP